MKEYKYIPDRNKEPKIVLQIVHGAKEYFERYSELVEFLLDNNIAVVGIDHPSHGSNFDYEKNNHNFSKSELINQTLEMSKKIKNEFHNSKHIILGHSMGSLVVRYIYHNNLFVYDKIILSGTTSPNKILVSIGEIYSKVNKQSSTSTLNNKLVFDNFAIKSEKRGYGKSWISASEEQNKIYEEDELCGKPFTNKSITSLLEITKNVVDDKVIGKTNIKNVPIFFIFGAMDPVGNFGIEIEKLVSKLRKNEYEKVYMKKYLNSKHELLFDNDKKEAYNDILNFINDEN